MEAVGCLMSNHNYHVGRRDYFSQKPVEEGRHDFWGPNVGVLMAYALAKLLRDASPSEGEQNRSLRSRTRERSLGIRAAENSPTHSSAQYLLGRGGHQSRPQIYGANYPSQS